MDTLHSDDTVPPVSTVYQYTLAQLIIGLSYLWRLILWL